MHSLSRTFAFRAKAFFCAALILAQPLLTGCGSAPITRIVIPAAARYHIELTHDHPMTAALDASVFEGAKAIDIFPGDEHFEVAFSDDRTISGKYAFVNGEFTIVEFGYAKQGDSARFTFSEAKQITAISTPRGEWKRPPESTIAPDPSLTGVEAYTAANADILEFARQLDEDNGKGDGDSLALLGVVLLYSGWLWAPIAGTMQLVLTVFVISTILQVDIGGRFDGTWDATNNASTLKLTIDNGRITRIVDVSSLQQFTIIQSDIQEVQGTNVSWKVLTRLLGQPSQVVFDFNVQEIANGALTGTLTTQNGGTATVPITMQRV